MSIHTEQWHILLIIFIGTKEFLLSLSMAIFTEEVSVLSMTMFSKEVSVLSMSAFTKELSMLPRTLR